MRCERMGPIPGLHAEGKPATIRAVSVLTIESGRIKVERDYWDMAEAMNTELRALRDAGCRLMQIEEPWPASVDAARSRAAWAAGGTASTSDWEGAI